MRRRELSPSFFSSQQVTSCSFPARLLFEGLWCLADREGRLVDDPWRIKLAVFPTDKVDVDELLDELVAQGLVVRYSVDGDGLLSLPTFTKWQHVHPHEVKSKLPALLPGHVITSHDTSLHVSECLSGSSGTSGSSESSDTTPPAPSQGVAATVFEVWRLETGHLQAKFTAQRQRAVRARLREGYRLDDLCDAVRGVALDPWPERVHHNDLAVICRDGAHVEKFRDLWRNPRPVVPLRRNPLDERIAQFGRGVEIQA